jgi:hypothetical protein
MNLVSSLILYTVSTSSKGSHVKYHIHAVLIQDIKELLSQTNVSFYHTLREGNQCAHFFAKLEASSDAGLLTHVSLLEDVHDFIKNNAMRTIFFRE